MLNFSKDRLLNDWGFVGEGPGLGCLDSLGSSHALPPTFADPFCNPVDLTCKRPNQRWGRMKVRSGLHGAHESQWDPVEAPRGKPRSPSSNPPSKPRSHNNLKDNLLHPIKVGTVCSGTDGPVHALRKLVGADQVSGVATCVPIVGGICLVAQSGGCLELVAIP